MQRSDWTLLAIAAANGEPVSPVQLQKSLFLLWKELPGEIKAPFYKFEPYNYGPFDSAVYDDAEALARQGFVARLRPTGKDWFVYAATPEGLQRAAAVKQDAPKSAVAYLADAVAWARSKSFQSLVSEIYRRYPEWRVNSVFQG